MARSAPTALYLGTLPVTPNNRNQLATWIADIESQVGNLGTFASFDPRIDGLAADVGASWAATDCPISMTKVGLGDTEWCIDARSSLALCTTAAQVNALYQGLARQPALDFTPSHLLTPDVDNNRFTDTAGDHLTLQGGGSGAEIDKSPLFDDRSAAGYQGRIVSGNASYYAAADATKYEFASSAFCVGWLGSCTQSPGGGVAVGKMHVLGTLTQGAGADPGLGYGWAVSVNSYGGFGFGVYGLDGFVNNDTAFPGATGPGVDDGKIRIFHSGRSVTNNLGFVRTAGFDPVTQAGDTGDITSSDALFGWLGHGASRVAMGDHQCQKMAVWEGAAAENVYAHIANIEAALQSQLAGVEQQLHRRKFVQDFVVGSNGRSLDVAFQPSALRPMWCSYTVSIDVGAAGNGAVRLLSDTANPPTTVLGEVRISGAGKISGVLTHLCPPAAYILLQTVDDGAGAPTTAIVTQYEVSLP